MVKIETGLTVRQQKAISTLLSSKTIEQAAKQAGVSRKTLYTWLRAPDFKAALSEATGEVLENAVRRLTALTSKAIDTLESVIDNPKTNTASRIRAATAILDTVLKIRELTVLESELRALEYRAQQLSEP